MTESIPAIVLGGSGYVGGELLRLLASHPHMHPASVVSRSRRHEAVETVFPNLRGVYPALRFTSLDDLPDTLGDRCAVFSTAAHGASAQLVDRALGACEERHCGASVVDVSADFRFRDPEAYEAVYGSSTAPLIACRCSGACCRSTPPRASLATSAIQDASPPGCCSPPCP